MVSPWHLCYANLLLQEKKRVCACPSFRLGLQWHPAVQREKEIRSFFLPRCITGNASENGRDAWAPLSLWTFANGTNCWRLGRRGNGKPTRGSTNAEQEKKQRTPSEADHLYSGFKGALQVINVTGIFKSSSKKHLVISHLPHWLHSIFLLNFFLLTLVLY